MDKVKRFNPDIKEGLTTEQVKDRIKNNLVNTDISVKNKTTGQIILGNIFTLFNLLNAALALCILLVGSYKNLLFMGVVIANTLISIIQELNAKRIIDKLSVISESKTTVIRNKTLEVIPIHEIVLDDIVKFEAGNQINMDSIIKEGTVEVNESFITGEVDPVFKKVGDMLLSGSFIVSGEAICKVEHIAEDNYTYKISKEAKYRKKPNSVIMNSINRIIKGISIVIIPLGLILFGKQLYLNNNMNEAVVSTVAAVIGMIPEGLVLLTSTVLVVSVIRLAKYKVLVQELYCIETLARVDTLCLDKTGTITEGVMEVVDVINLNKKYDHKQILTDLAYNATDTNGTITAIRHKFNGKNKREALSFIPFSSSRKYSGVNFENESYVIGAPEILTNDKSVLKKVDTYDTDHRVVLLAKTDNLNTNTKPNKIEPIALILIRDKIRKNAKKTLEYFKKEGVDLKIISGDNPKTVSRIAKQVGFEHANYIDMSKYEDEDYDSIVSIYSIFGRVNPIQKREIIKALKKAGHTVGMTGDGVNDVLALKESDCAIAMASGTDAARNVAEVVLLDDNFDAMPKVLLEGRRTINNIERSATLFLVKSIYSFLLALIFVFINHTYPFIPIQLTLISVFTIGIPSFFLALEPNKERVKGNFLTNVALRAIPTALTIVLAIMIIIGIGHYSSIPIMQIETICVLTTGGIAFILLYQLCYPFNFFRRILFGTMIFGFLLGITAFSEFFSLTNFSLEMILLTVFILAGALMLLSAVTLLTKKRISKRKDKI